MLTQDLTVLLDHSPDPIARFDPDLRLVYVNPATARFNARPLRDFAGKTMEDLRHAPEVCNLINSGLRRVFSLRKEQIVELEFDAPEQGRLVFQSRMAPEFAEDGAVEFVLVISRDITELRRTQEALSTADSDKLLAEHSAQLAHAIHNPIFAAMNAVYLLQRNASLDADARELVALIGEQIDRVTRLSNEMLTITGRRSDSCS